LRNLDEFLESLTDPRERELVQAFSRLYADPSIPEDDYSSRVREVLDSLLMGKDDETSSPQGS